MTLEQRLDFAVEFLKNALVLDAPVDSGNLAQNAIRIQYDVSTPTIVLGGGVAPYVIYTEYKNASSLGWIHSCIHSNKYMFQQIMGGGITIQELEGTLGKQARDIQAKFDKLAKEVK